MTLTMPYGIESTVGIRGKQRQRSENVLRSPTLTICPRRCLFPRGVMIQNAQHVIRGVQSLLRVLNQDVRWTWKSPHPWQSLLTGVVLNHGPGPADYFFVTTVGQSPYLFKFGQEPSLVKECPISVCCHSSTRMAKDVRSQSGSGGRQII